MQHAMAEIAKRGRDFGARYIITFVENENVPSLKGCKRAGFSPYVERIERRRLFQHTYEFNPLPDGTPYPFDAVPSQSAVAH